MPHSEGFLCHVVDAREHTKVLTTRDNISEARACRITAAWLGGAPQEGGQNPPMNIGLYIGRDALQHSTWLSSRIGSQDCMVYIFTNGKRLFGPIPLSTLERQPVLLPAGSSSRHKENALHGRRAMAEEWPLEQHGAMFGHTDIISLSQLEVIVTPRWTEPIPLLRPEEYARSQHLAYFRFSSLPTQTINVSGIAILPHDFWIHERELSANWEPLKRKVPPPMPPTGIMSNRGQHRAEPVIGPGLLDWQYCNHSAQ